MEENQNQQEVQQESKKEDSKVKILNFVSKAIDYFKSDKFKHLIFYFAILSCINYVIKGYGLFSGGSMGVADIAYYIGCWTSAIFFLLFAYIFKPEDNKK